MNFKTGTKVKAKTWDEISKTVIPFADKTIDGYRHKTSGLVYIPTEFIADLDKTFVINRRDEDGDYELTGSFNYYHEDWLEKV